MTRLLCTRCGDSIHRDTAARNEGLCMPCVHGNQLTIGQRQAQHAQKREEERARLASPEHLYWISLVDRVFKTQGGFDALPRGDQLYYLVSALVGEVFNGGFDQFFSNSSGNRYEETVAALIELGDQDSLPLLLEAKNALFAEASVPVERTRRCQLMPTMSEDHPRFQAAADALDALDKRFYADSTRLADTLERIAAEHGLYALKPP